MVNNGVEAEKERCYLDVLIDVFVYTPILSCFRRLLRSANAAVLPTNKTNTKAIGSNVGP